MSMPKLHWVLKAMLWAIVVAVVLVVGGTIAMRYGMGSTTAAVGGVMFLAGLPVGGLVLIVALFRGWRKARRQKARGRGGAAARGGTAARPAARGAPRTAARAPARR